MVSVSVKVRVRVRISVRVRVTVAARVKLCITIRGLALTRYVTATLPPRSEGSVDG